MARYCGNCGTEVDDLAVFCPTCGQPIDEAEAPEIPAAPAWPEPAAPAQPEDRHEAPYADAGEAAAPVEESEPEPTSADRWGYAAPAPERPVEPEPRAWEQPPEVYDEAPTRVEERPPAPDPSVPPPMPAASPRAVPPPDRGGADAGRPSGSAGAELPITMPVTLSSWLIGIGSVLAALGLIIVLVTGSLNVIDLLLLLAMLAVAATVWLAAQMPAIPNLRLIALTVALVAFGVALDRVAVTGAGAGELLLFLGSAAAGIGAILLELGQDQPLGGPQS